MTVKNNRKIGLICHFGGNSFGKSGFMDINKITIDKEKTNNFRFYGKNIRPFMDNENTHYHPHAEIPP